MPLLLPVEVFAKSMNPFVWQPWQGYEVTMSQVQQALDEGRLVSVPTQIDHAGRIAFLVVNEQSDPVEIDVGVPELDCFVDWPIQDGNHRVAAAIFANRELIRASVSGSVLHAELLFGVDCKEEFDEQVVTECRTFPGSY